MKSIDLNDIDDLPGVRVDENVEFKFRCHEKLNCFNLCCRNLNLFLYPYDVLRLKNNLGLSSGEFIDKYVDVVMRESSFFPEVLLRMEENDQKTCPFLTDEGCTVYEDRPDSCRTFPVEQGVMMGSEKKETELIHFFRPPEFCEGKNEDKVWTTKTWAKDQEAEKYNKMTVLWSEVKGLFQTDPWGIPGIDGPKGKMAFMSTYNIDEFSDFVFKSSFLKRFKIKPDILKKIKRDQTELMKLGFLWMKFYIWGIKTNKIKQRG